MTRFSDEVLMRRADGELSEAQCREIDRAAETDPRLAERLRLMRASRDEARRAFPAAADAADDALAALIAAAPSPVAPARAATSDVRFGLPGFMRARGFLLGWGAGAAMAAAAAWVLAVVLQPSAALIDPSGRLDDAALVRVLDSRLAAEGPDARGYAIGLTYQDRDGAWCRTFTASDQGFAGLACREDDRWRLETLARAEAATGELRTASSALPEAVLAAVDQTLAVDPVDADGETAARDAGWR